MIRQSAAAALLVLTALLGGCGEEQEPELVVADLTEQERRYVERVVTLERAKAVALVDRPAGESLLDSLSAAWGDSSLSDTLAGVPDDPRRAAALGKLLSDLLLAEQDSLLLAPRPDRLEAPLPERLPPEPPAAEDD